MPSPWRRRRDALLTVLAGSPARLALTSAVLTLVVVLVLGLGARSLYRRWSEVPPWPTALEGTPQSGGAPLLMPGDTAPAPQEATLAPGTMLACSVQRSAPVAFLGAEPRETLRVAIRGEPCGQALLRLWVEDDQGRVRYGYEAPLLRHVTLAADDPALADAAVSLADAALARASIAGTTDRLPSYDAARFFYARDSGSLRVTPEVYELLRGHHWPILWHPTGSNTWRLVVYDQELVQARVILEGGP